MSYNALRRGRVSQAGTVYHVTTVTRDRAPVFAAFDAGRTVVRALRALHEEGSARTLCFVLMPDHLHWLMQLERGTLADALRRLKGRSARALGRAVWQASYHDHALRADEDLRATARYIVANPLRAGLVEHIGAYSLCGTRCGWTTVLRVDRP